MKRKFVKFRSVLKCRTLVSNHVENPLMGLGCPVYIFLATRVRGTVLGLVYLLMHLPEVAKVHPVLVALLCT